MIGGDKNQKEEVIKKKRLSPDNQSSLTLKSNTMKNTVQI